MQSFLELSKATLKKNSLMPPLSPTHRYVEKPQIGVRYLADYMAASKKGSKKGERSILQQSKYRSLAPMLHHTDAKNTVSKFVRNGKLGVEWLIEAATDLRNRLADGDFERHLLDTNADYIARFASIEHSIEWPKAEIYAPGKPGHITVHGVKVNVGFQWRLRRTTKTNKVREGAAMLRYAKGKALSLEAGGYQSAFILGYLRDTSIDSTVDFENKLCLTVDAQAGICHPAPTNSLSRYQNMQAACATIAEQWDNIKPPPGAILFP